MSTSGQPGRPRSLADDLRARSDGDLARLLELRPDLLHPTPPDLGQLAVRAASSTSVSLALDGLDALHLQVCHALAALPDATTAQEVHAGLRGCPGYNESAVDHALGDLRTRALVWGDDLHLVRVARESFGAYPCGLGPAMAHSRKAVAEYASNPSLVRDLLSSASEEAQAVVSKLMWNPSGTLPDVQKTGSKKAVNTPLDWLLERDFIVATGPTTVVMPREVSLALREGQLLDAIQVTNTSAVTGHIEPARADASGALAALDILRLTESLLEQWSFDPPSALRGGGIAARDFTATSHFLAAPEAVTALVIEVAGAANLLNTAPDGDVVPTSAYDAWLGSTDAHRWTLLARSWVDMARAPHVVTDEASEKANVLSAGIDRGYIAGVRLGVLEALAGAAPGSTTDAPAMTSHFSWVRPRRASRVREVAITAVLSEAELLGITCGGALTSFGRAVVEHTDTAAALSQHIPASVDHIIVQADLTALAPGRLPAAAARMMSQLADVESTGVATTYRFTQASLSRALDHGHTVEEVSEFLSSLSKTSLPQPLTYMLSDLARGHGHLRVGVASVYLRCEDPAVIQTIAADKRLATLGLRELAPGLLVSGSPADVVLERLRNAGYAPAPETADGTIVLARPEPRRTAAKSSTPDVHVSRVAPEVAAQAVRKLRRAGDGGGEAVGARMTSTEVMELLAAALDTSAEVVIGYADKAGAMDDRTVEPLSLAGGFLTAFDVRSGEVRTFTVARIASAALTSDEKEEAS